MREKVDWSFTDDKIVIFGVNRFYLMKEVLFIILSYFSRKNKLGVVLFF